MDKRRKEENAFFSLLVFTKVDWTNGKVFVFICRGFIVDKRREEKIAFFSLIIF